MEKENIVTKDYPEFTVGEPVAKLILKDDGYHVVDFDGEEGPVCGYCGNNASKVTDDNPATAVVLTPNASCRQWANIAKANKSIDEKGYYDLTYKPHKTIGPIGNKMPNEKLIAYLPEDLQAEYRSIVERAKAARDADKAKPMSDLEKAKAKLAKAQEALAKLEAEVAELG